MFFTNPAWGNFLIKHGFFGRQGGVSQGIYQSLNCGLGTKDNPDLVKRNRHIVLEALDLSSTCLMTAHQIHSTKVQTIDANFLESWAEERPQLDAFVTKLQGITLGVLTADCLPVLFVDPNARVIGAAHAGWKGALGGILETTIQAMVDLGAQNDQIQACLGPCIGPQSYQVQQDFYDQFLIFSPNAALFFQPSHHGAYFFDLAGFARHRLEQTGIKMIDHIQHDTKAEEDLFFSYRRSCLNHEPDYGRQLSVIAL